MKAKDKRKVQIAVDILMAAILLLQMSYSIAGELIHEICGICFFVLFALHHILSFNMTKALFKGKKSPDKFLKIINDALLLIIFIAMMLSAVPLSKYIFSFLKIASLSGISRTVHLLGAYWGFALISIHIGFHFDIMLSKIMKDKQKRTPAIIIMAIIFALGLFIFIKEGIIKYMLLINQFVYFDKSGSLALFLIKYIMIMLMFAVFGFALIKLTKIKIRRKKL